jgi:methylphosphotriester-DNA--protein-cysteine methyltransferase
MRERRDVHHRIVYFDHLSTISPPEMTAPTAPNPLAFPGNQRPVLVMEPALFALFSRLGRPYACVGGVGWAEVDEPLQHAPASTLVVVDPYAGPRRGGLFPRVRTLLRRFPSIPVVAAVERREVNADVTMLLEWGISEVIVLGPESVPLALARRLDQAHARPFKRALEVSFSPYVSGEARQILMAAAEVAAEGGQAPELGARMRVSARTLSDHCVRADLPSPRTVQAWMRVLLACMLLDDPGRTVYGAAYASGYHTERSLRRAITALLGTDSTALRRAGAFSTAVRAFGAVLRDAREDGRQRRRRELQQLLLKTGKE